MNTDTRTMLKNKGFDINNHDWGRDSKGNDYEVYANEIVINSETHKLLVNLKPRFIEFATCLLGDNNALKIVLADKYDEFLIDTVKETSHYSGLIKPNTPASFFLRLDNYLNKLNANCGYDEMIDCIYLDSFVEYYKKLGETNK